MKFQFSIVNHVNTNMLLKIAEFSNIAELLLTFSESEENDTITLNADLVRRFAEIRCGVGLPLKLVLYCNEKFSVDRQSFDENMSLLKKAKIHAQFADESFDEFDFEQWFVRPH